MANEPNAIVLFDGVCNLCDRTVQWLIARDRHDRLRFASLQSPIGRELLSRHQLPTDYLDSMILIEGDKAWLGSGAAIRVAEVLGGGYRLMSLCWAIPAFLRNRLYSFIAVRRYRWFGKREQCLAPTPALKAKFLDH